MIFLFNGFSIHVFAELVSLQLTLNQLPELSLIFNHFSTVADARFTLHFNARVITPESFDFPNETNPSDFRIMRQY